jgi:hypothetical protein
MMTLSPLMRRTFDAPCRIEIEHTSASLHAHVEFDERFVVRPGDEIRVHHAPVDVPFGERVVVNGKATITQVGIVERLWTHLASWREMTELYEVSFTDRRCL